MQSAIERAFELARSGKFESVDMLRKQLKTERYEPGDIVGPSLSKQLRALIRESRRHTDKLP